MAKPQLEMVVDDPARAAAEETLEIENERLARAELWAAMRGVARELSYDVCARELDKRWGDLGRPVSASVLRSALNDVERNNFRGEWFYWFAKRSERVADLLLEMGGSARPTKPPDVELEDLKDVLRRDYPRQAENLIRKGKAPRR